MSNIRTTKIDGVEFVTYKDYLRLKEIAHNGLEELKKAAETIKELEEENKNLKSDLEQFSEAYKRYRDYEKEELAESCYDLERENQKLKEERDELKKEFQQYKEHYNIEKDKQQIFLMTGLRY